MDSNQVGVRHAVVTRKSTGIGSDLVSVIGAIEYARKTSRDVIIDWRKSRYVSNPTINVFGEIFEPPLPVEGLTLSIAESGFSDAQLPAPLQYLSSKSTTFEDFHAEMLREPRPVQQSVIVTRPMHHLPAPSVQRQWLGGIKPVSRLSATIDEFHQRHMTAAPVVGIHIRHGNGEKLGSDRDKLLGRGVDDLITLCQQHMQSMSIPASARIFVCTDSAELRDRFAARVDGVFSFGSRIGSARKGPIHTNLYGLQGAEDAVAEMWLLARCNWLLYTPSWFSHYARIMGTFEQEPVNLDTVSLYGSDRLYEAKVKERKSLLQRLFRALGFGR